MSTKKILSLMIASSFLTLGPIGCGRQQESESSSVVVPPPVVPAQLPISTGDTETYLKKNKDESGAAIKILSSYEEKRIIHRYMISQHIEFESDAKYGKIGTFIPVEKWVQLDPTFGETGYVESPDVEANRALVEFSRPELAGKPLNIRIFGSENSRKRLTYCVHQIYDGHAKAVNASAERELANPSEEYWQFFEQFEALYQTGNLQGRLALLADKEGLLHFENEDPTLKVSPFNAGKLKTQVRAPLGQVVRRVANRYQMLWHLSKAGSKFDPVMHALFEAGIATVEVADRSFKKPQGAEIGLIMLKFAQEIAVELFSRISGNDHLESVSEKIDLMGLQFSLLVTSFDSEFKLSMNSLIESSIDRNIRYNSALRLKRVATYVDKLRNIK